MAYFNEFTDGLQDLFSRDFSGRSRPLRGRSGFPPFRYRSSLFPRSLRTVVEPVETTTALRFLITHRGLITNSLSPVAAFGVAPIPNAA